MLSEQGPRSSFSTGIWAGNESAVASRQLDDRAVDRRAGRWPWAGGESAGTAQDHRLGHRGCRGVRRRGSSGRIRRELGLIPPGDLRMALAALCGDDTWGRTWSRVLQHRFEGSGELAGHAVGNLLISALWEETDDPWPVWIGWPRCSKLRAGAAGRLRTG